LVQEVPAGNGTIVVGEVVHLHVDPSVWRAGCVDPELLDPVGRLAGTGYAGLGAVLHLERPTWRELSAQGRPRPRPEGP
jgi:flavin reductase (DIM6/NTAB) family NADH-FMN oxidoreductase RutF